MNNKNPVNGEYVSKNNKHLCMSVVSLLLEKGNVVIPELGNLELTVFPNKRTVLFKAKENLSLCLAAESSIQSFIYNSISLPLKEGKVVTLPEIGVFRPLKNVDGSYRISYTISSSLRKLLNNEGKSETEKPEIPATSVKEEKLKIPIETRDEITFTLVDDNEMPEKGTREERKYEAIKHNKKIREQAISSLKQEVSREQKKPSKYSIAVIVVIGTLVLLAWYKYRDEFPENKTEFVQEINEAAKSGKSIDLPSIAEQKYGNRIFWIYIYEANRDKIASPVNIPVETDLQIPDLWEDYKVDVADSIEIKRAGILAYIILK
jgi:hypothetical protein